MHVHRAAAVAGGRSGKSPRFVEVLLRMLELPAPDVDQRRPDEQPRKQRPLTEAARQRDRALREREPRIPVAGAGQELDRHLVRPHAQERRVKLVGETLALTEVVGELS
jgi:hypothetical protein